MDNWILSLQNPLVKHLHKLKNDKSYRLEQKSILIEGSALIEELIPYVTFKNIFTIDKALIPKNIKSKSIYLTDFKILSKISSTVSPEGIIAEIEFQEKNDLHDKNYLIALDGIQDPGNLGTLFRTALALGWEGLFLLEGCCDPYNDKALRSARGATFKIPFKFGTKKDLFNLINEESFTALAADIEGENPQKFINQEKIFLILGNEGRGLSPEIKENCQKITIPMKQDVESLNVSIAGGILMYVLRSQY